jgi:hypothetical protein
MHGRCHAHAALDATGLDAWRLLAQPMASVAMSMHSSSPVLPICQP